MYLSISFKTTNNTESFSIYTLVNFRTIGVFINQNFIEKHYLNIYKLSKPIPIYNINGTSNKNRQILEVVNVVLYYQIYSEWALLTVSQLDKQDLIFSFIWLKKHNLKVDWYKVMIQCFICCSSYQDICRAEKH